MTRWFRLLASIAAWLIIGAPPLAAQTMFKCVDAGGRITYSNISCEKQSLKDAGVVADRTTTLPLPPLPVVPAKSGKPANSAPRTADEPPADRSPARVKPVVPLLEKLSK